MCNNEYLIFHVHDYMFESLSFYLYCWVQFQLYKTWQSGYGQWDEVFIITYFMKDFRFKRFAAAATKILNLVLNTSHW
jgi:hypothetical protein